MDKIVTGKLEKYYQDVVLLEELFIKDTNLTVRKYQAQQEQQAGGPLNVVRFIRYQLGDRG